MQNFICRAFAVFPQLINGPSLATSATALCLALSGPANAATYTFTASAVSGWGSNTPEGLSPVNVTSLGGAAIPFYIPLSPGKSGTYGNGSSCGGNGVGTCSDTVTVSPFKAPDSGSLSMYLSFTLTESGSSKLTVLFNDLDLFPQNDPNGFSETVKATFKAVGQTPVLKTGTISSVGGSVTELGNDVLQLEADLGSLTAGTYYLLLSFTSTINKRELNGHVTNTLEHLRALITTTTKDSGSGEVPLPGALVLFGTVLAGSAGFGAWRRRRSERLS